MPLNIKAVAKRIRHHDESLEDDLQEFANTDLLGCIELLHSVLFSDVLYMEAGACAYVLEQLQKIWGQDRTNCWLLEKWREFSDEEKRRICYGSFSKGALPTEIASRLFALPVSSVRDKHQLLAGLAASAEVRHCESLVKQMADELAAHVNLSDSPKLAEMIRNIRQSYETGPK